MKWIWHSWDCAVFVINYFVIKAEARIGLRRCKTRIIFYAYAKNSEAWYSLQYDTYDTMQNV